LLDWDEIADEPLIVNEAARGMPSATFQRLASEARFSVRNVASLLAMVQAGMGVTLLPALATVNLPAVLTARDLRDPACMRTVGIYARAGRSLSPVAQVFFDEFVVGAHQEIRDFGLAL
jgi:DNA-binding transcriptional LysR family regulator